MRISEYFQIGKRLKDIRKSNNYSQKEIAKKLSLSNSAYSNYENGYSEPPFEIIEEFCSIMEITVNAFFEFKIESTSRQIKTFADLIYILIDLDRRGLKISGNTTYSNDNNQLCAHLELDIPNPQLATFIPNWNKVNEDVKKGLVDEDEYNVWLEDTLRLFNVKIDDYL